jgi:uncharacterized protein with von Willebrand factor type A (vWA) domain
VWLSRLTSQFRHCAWLNPMPEHSWQHSVSIGMIRQKLHGRMFPLTLDGLDRLAREMQHGHA